MAEKSIDEILADIPDDQRAALERLRGIVRAAAPSAEEGISYGLAAFRLDGKPLAGFGASAKHCAFYPMSGSIVKQFAKELKNYETSKGAIRFSVEKPLPATLVRKLVKARAAEIAAPQAKPKKPSAAAKKRPAADADSQIDPAVTAFMKELRHPLKPAIEAVRQIMLAVDPEIREGIKWNSPSFRTKEYFSTLNLKGDRVWLILHFGAKVKASTAKGIAIADPESLLEWPAKDRAVVKFDDAADVETKRAALQAVVRQWIRHV